MTPSSKICIGGVSMHAMVLGICSAFFFAFSFILNRAMELDGGSWMWSASLRYYFMLIFLLMIVGVRRNLGALFREMKQSPRQWLLWSVVGFGIFYALLTFSASFAPGWLIAGTWQITIISGSLLAPLFLEKVKMPDGQTYTRRGRIPWNRLTYSTLIVIGVFVIQLAQSAVLPISDLFLCFLSMIIASFAYPLGNRKMMEVCGNRLDAYQRVLGMTIASMPVWLLLSAIAFFTHGPPSVSQISNSALVAATAGVAATVLFFAATDLVKDDMEKLGSVEATQSFAVLFAVAGEVLLLSGSLPSPLSWAGIALIVIGMILHSIKSHRKASVPLSLSEKEKHPMP